MPTDEPGRGREATVAVKRGDHRFERVGENGRIAAPAGFLLALRQPEKSAEVDAARHIGERIAIDQRGVAAGKVSFILTRKALGQEIGDDETENPIAEKLESLECAGVMVSRGFRQTRMGERGNQ